MTVYRGSEWNKWDLHVHTASSYDYDYKGADADDLLCAKVESFLNCKENILAQILIENILFKKIEKGDSCSLYYKEIKDLLFWTDGKDNREKIHSLDQSLKDYIIKLVGFIEIYEKNQNITEVESKLQGALLYIILNFLDFAKKYWSQTI